MLQLHYYVGADFLFIKVANRNIQTDRWADNWFSALSPIEKLSFIYLCDNCDIAGFIEVNFKRMAFDIGYTVDEIKGALKGLTRGLVATSRNDVFYLKNFLKHQRNLPLSPITNTAHRGIARRFVYYLEIIDYQYFEPILSLSKDAIIEGSKHQNTKGATKPLIRGTSNSNSNSNDLNTNKYTLENTLETTKDNSKDDTIQLWQTTKNILLTDTGWRKKFTDDGLTKKQFDGLLENFLKDRDKGGNDERMKSINELKSWFRNWFNQKKEKGEFIKPELPKKQTARDFLNK